MDKISWDDISLLGESDCRDILCLRADYSDDNGNISLLASNEQFLKMVPNSKMPTNNRIPIMFCYKDISNDSD